MGLFGKDKLSEVEAAGMFVISMVRPIQQEWPKVAADLTHILQLKQPISTDHFAAFEFVLAVIAVEIQALPNQSLQQGEPPFSGIASVLFDKLGCQSSVELGNARFKDPLFLMALSEKVITSGGAWWKNAIQRYKLVP